jgi:hypothetical protein
LIIVNWYTPFFIVVSEVQWILGAPAPIRFGFHSFKIRF